MTYLRKETLARIGATQDQLDGIRMAMRRLDELCRDLEVVGKALEDACRPVSDGTAIADLELVRLERELESEVRQCLANTNVHGNYRG